MLQQSVRDLNQAFKNWWKSKDRVRSPRFKSRRSRQSMRVCGREFHPTDRGVRFPKIGELKLKWSRPLLSPPTNITLVKECSGRYYASFVVEAEEIKLSWTPKEVGIDLGLASLVVTSGGEKIAPSQVPALCVKDDQEVTGEPKGEGFQ